MLPTRAVAKGCALACLVAAMFGGLPVLGALILTATGQITPSWPGIVFLAIWCVVWLAGAHYLWRRADRFAQQR